ncbi:hypothetical protein [Heyndrickxia oleronia]|uniref:hypothetical protein n=1 Tax=Heyndrickxia oleronia TaxID=38875 RepID=UPI001B27DE3A|nr:hypothetical protein [Heyndrickxia oleronia]GIN42349.1 hypothetical protein J19TS1_52980 [Heyndrickxia oleronia]
MSIEKEVEFTAIKLDNLELLCPNVNGRYLIQFEYKKEFKNQSKNLVEISIRDIFLKMHNKNVRTITERLELNYGKH